MSNTSSFPSETLLLYQSKPTEILATENVAQASTAGQWVGDKGCPVKETSHFPTLQNSHSSKKKECGLTYSGSQRLAGSATSWSLTPFHCPGAPWNKKPQCYVL